MRSHRLRRLKPLTPTLSPATHSAMPSMLPCCTSDLKRRNIIGPPTEVSSPHADSDIGLSALYPVPSRQAQPATPAVAIVPSSLSFRRRRNKAFLQLAAGHGARIIYVMAISAPSL